jgi:putative transport protein
MEWLSSMLAKYPELAVFLAIGIGYWIGSLKLGGFSLGGVTGSLMAGIVIGLLFKVPVAATAKSLIFLLFLFGIGYEVGPRFFAAMKGAGWRFAVLGAFMPVVGLLTAWQVARFLDLDQGFAAGMLSGALTESPAMGTASEAINALNIADGLKQTLVAHIGVADALCYVFGALGVILVCSTIGPRLLGIDLHEEALKLEAQYGIKRTRAGVASAWKPFEFRAYRVDPSARAAGKTVAEAEQLEPGMRLFVERIRRGNEILEVQADTRLLAGDVVVISGRREALVGVLGARAQEADDRELLDIPVASFQIFVSAKGIAGRTLEDLAGEDAVRGVFLRQVVRYGQEIPIGTQTVIERGDVLHVVGSEAAVLRAVPILGEVIGPSDVTDFFTVGTAIFIGALAGAAASFAFGGVQISIGTSVGTLIAGIMVGYARSLRPVFGRVPDGAVKFMQSFGLAGFVAMVGIGAGPHFVEGVRQAGLSVLLGGMVVTLMPLIVGLYFGRYVLRINPLLLLGALSGAQTFTPGLAAVQEKSGSSIAVLGYSGAVPVGHVFLTMFGTVIVLLMSR